MVFGESVVAEYICARKRFKRNGNNPKVEFGNFKENPYSNFSKHVLQLDEDASLLSLFCRC